MVLGKPKSGLAGHERDLLDRPLTPSCPDGPVGPAGPRLTSSILSNPIPFIRLIPLNFLCLTLQAQPLHVGYVRTHADYRARKGIRGIGGCWGHIPHIAGRPILRYNSLEVMLCNMYLPTK